MRQIKRVDVDFPQAVIPRAPYGHELHLFQQDSDSHLAAAAVKYGATLLQRTQVDDIHIDGLGVELVTAAGDTYRAAATEQLQFWGDRTGCEVIAGPSGGDPSAVAFETVKVAVARGAAVAIIDTAGRLQTQRPLMDELAKMVRVIGRDLPGAPHETLLVLDANTGQNAISQAREFTRAAGVTGLILTKLDGTAKGGVIVGLADEFGIPIRFVGVGEAVEDLREFRAQEFVEAVFET